MKRFVCLVFIACVSALMWDSFNYNNLFKLCEKHINNVCSKMSYSDAQVIEFVGVDYEDLLRELNVQIINKNNISDRLIIEGYSNLLSEYCVINDRKVNIQISVCDNKVILGYPFISGSF